MRCAFVVFMCCVAACGTSSSPAPATPDAETPGDAPTTDASIAFGTPVGSVTGLKKEKCDFWDAL